MHSKFANLGADFYSSVDVKPLPNPKLVAVSNSALDLIGGCQDVTQYFSGNKKFPNANSIASVYAGHQFGTYVPQLGDGRAILLGEKNGWEIQLKGAGKTPYSRMGDGRAVLRSCIREFLCSEHMHALGIPTTRAVCVVTSAEDVQRESLEKAAMLTRIAPSHIRFGHFEYFYYTNQHKQLKQLLDFTISNYFAGASAADFFEKVVISTAQLMAKWQAVGFCHGVMNTDNMSVLGLTIDYGPFGFMGVYNPVHICNHSDYTGRYAFDMQAGIGLWNLQKLAQALSPFISYEVAMAILQKYQPALVAEYASLMRAKLGIAQPEEGDFKILAELLNIMQANELDYTLTFRSLAEKAVPDILQNWHEKYKGRFAASSNLVNPKYILRNYLMQNAIEQADANDFSGAAKLLEVMSNPFGVQPENASFAAPPPIGTPEPEISCSS